MLQQVNAMKENEARSPAKPTEAGQLRTEGGGTGSAEKNHLVDGSKALRKTEEILNDLQNLH